MRSDVSLMKGILQFCRDIEESVERFGNDIDEFMTNRSYQHACAFCILQIGESVGGLSEELKKKYSGTEWSRIKGMRNFIAHGYHGIDLETVWVAVTEDVPVLREVCENILSDLEMS